MFRKKHGRKGVLNLHLLKSQDLVRTVNDLAIAIHTVNVDAANWSGRHIEVEFFCLLLKRYNWVGKSKRLG